MADDFEHFVKRSFGGMRASAASNIIAAKIFLDVLLGVWRGATSQARRDVLRDEARALLEQAKEELSGPALGEARQRLALFEQATAA